MVCNKELKDNDNENNTAGAKGWLHYSDEGLREEEQQHRGY